MRATRVAGDPTTARWTGRAEQDGQCGSSSAGATLRDAGLPTRGQRPQEQAFGALTQGSHPGLADHDPGISSQSRPTAIQPARCSRPDRHRLVLDALDDPMGPVLAGSAPTGLSSGADVQPVLCTANVSRRAWGRRIGWSEVPGHSKPHKRRSIPDLYQSVFLALKPIGPSPS